MLFLPDEAAFLSRAMQMRFASHLVPNCARHANVPLCSCYSPARLITPWLVWSHLPCCEVPVVGSVSGEYSCRVTNLKETIHAVLKWGLFCFKDGHCSMQKGDMHLPALSKKAIPTCSAGEAAARWRGTEKLYWEQIMSWVFFSWVTSWKVLWVGISNLSSPSLTHCGPNLLKHMSHSVVYPSLESVPTRRGCILWCAGEWGY